MNFTHFYLKLFKLKFHFICIIFSEIVECKEPIEVVSYKIGVCKISPKGKECKTLFQKLGYNGKTSVVLCKPRTGRMHQIRVHLQYLGKYTYTHLTLFSIHFIILLYCFNIIQRLQ